MSEHENVIPSDHLLYPTPERVAEATNLLRRETVTGEYLHPAVRANCEQVLRYSDEIFGRQITVPLQINGAMPIATTPVAANDGGGVWTMTDAEFQEALREAREEAWTEGATAGWKQSGEGWNSEYPDQSTGNCSVDLSENPHRQM
jgi:hypothetical protein